MRAFARDCPRLYGFLRPGGRKARRTVLRLAREQGFKKTLFMVLHPGTGPFGDQTRDSGPFVGNPGDFGNRMCSLAPDLTILVKPIAGGVLPGDTTVMQSDNFPLIVETGEPDEPFSVSAS